MEIVKSYQMIMKTIRTFLPSRSTSKMDMNAPASCKEPNTIEALLGDIVLPAAEKISLTKETTAKIPT